MTLMTQLESDKKKIKISVPDQKLVCERFAFRVFEMADQEDRSGHSTKTTARTFQAASIFFEILEQFGEHSDEVKCFQYFSDYVQCYLRMLVCPFPSDYPNQILFVCYILLC